jgi:hypothetical protein
MTANTNDLSSIALGLANIEGVDFATATDTLHAIAVNGTNSLANIKVGAVAGGTTIVGGTTMTANTNDLSSIALGLANIEGVDFATATDTLHAIAVTGTNSLANINVNKLGTPAGASVSADILTANNALTNGTTGLSAIKTAVTTLGTEALATAAVQTIQGTTISNINTATVTTIPTAIAAQTLALQGATTANTLTALAGAGFATGTNSLVAVTAVLAAIAKQAALTQVVSAASNPALLCEVTDATNAAGFNTALGNALSAVRTAQTTPDNGNIVGAQTAVNNLVTAASALGGTASSPYTISTVTFAAQQLQIAVNNWLEFYPEA